MKKHLLPLLVMALILVAFIGLPLYLTKDDTPHSLTLPEEIIELSPSQQIINSINKITIPIAFTDKEQALVTLKQEVLKEVQDLDQRRLDSSKLLDQRQARMDKREEGLNQKEKDLEEVEVQKMGWFSIADKVPVGNRWVLLHGPSFKQHTYVVARWLKICPKGNHWEISMGCKTKIGHTPVDEEVYWAFYNRFIATCEQEPTEIIEIEHSAITVTAVPTTFSGITESSDPHSEIEIEGPMPEEPVHNLKHIGSAGETLLDLTQSTMEEIEEDVNQIQEEIIKEINRKTA